MHVSVNKSGPFAARRIDPRLVSAPLAFPWRAASLAAGRALRICGSIFTLARWSVSWDPSGAPYVAWVRASDVHFGYWRMAFVANADDPVNLGVVMPEN